MELWIRGEDVTPEADLLNKLRINSLGIIAILVECEDQFHVDLSDKNKDIEAIHTVDQLGNFVWGTINAAVYNKTERTSQSNTPLSFDILWEHNLQAEKYEAQRKPQPREETTIRPENDIKKVSKNYNNSFLGTSTIE